jgi:hypothetical protein
LSFAHLDRGVYRSIYHSQTTAIVRDIPVSFVGDRLFDRIPDSCTIHEVPVRLPWGQGLHLVDHADDPRTRAERIKLTWSLILLAVHPVSRFDKILCPVCVTIAKPLASTMIITSTSGLYTPLATRVKVSKRRTLNSVGA